MFKMHYIDFRTLSRKITKTCDSNVTELFDRLLTQYQFKLDHFKLIVKKKLSNIMKCKQHFFFGSYFVDIIFYWSFGRLVDESPVLYWPVYLYGF